MARKPSREEVEIRAYEIYVGRGGEDGHDVEDWIAAEEELSARPVSEPESSSTVTSAPQTTLHRTAAASGSDRR
jgi:hypothetical protein